MTNKSVLVDSSSHMVVSTARTTALVLVGSVLLAISAHVEIPFWPVPITMQSFVVLMLGFGYSLPLAFSAILLYLLEGFLGFPVFAGGAGVAYMVGPTGGYLFGFFIAALVLRALRGRGMDKSFLGLFVSALLADISIFICGVSWLAGFVGLDKAIEVGVLPFVLGDLLKVGFVSLAIGIMRRYFGDGKTLSES